MQKRIYKKKRYSNKLVPFQWGWLLAGGALIISCLLLVAIVTSQGQAFTNDATIHLPVTSITATPASIRSDATIAINADQLTGVFPLTAGGPIPVPANVLHPTNIARINIDNVLVSIYAGSMARTPTIGVLAILRENLTTGEQNLHLYQTAQPVGALTILTAHNTILTFSTAKENGTFNLVTNQFSAVG